MDGTRAYFAQIGSLPRLTVEEEVHYARIYSQARHDLVANLCFFPDIVAGVLGKIGRIQRMSALAEYLHLREFEDLGALKEQLLVGVHQVEDLASEFSRQPNLHRLEPDQWCPELREQLRALLTELALRDAFWERCIEALPEPEAEQGSTAGKYAELYRGIRECLQEQARAKTALVEGNLRLVASLASKYVNCGLPYMDLIQEGNIGLVRAVENFEVERGHRFSTYASFWIRRSIMKALTEQSRIIRLPASMVAMLRQISKAREEALREHGYEPSPEELAGMLDVPAARIRALTKMSHQMISLQGPLTDESGRQLIDRLCDEEVEPPEKKVADSILKDALFSAIETLSERERRILTMHYGLNGQTPSTLDQIAVHYQLTGERIRQIEQTALKKLRDPSRRQLIDAGRG